MPKPHGGNSPFVPIVVLTQPASEADVRRALAKIDRMPEVAAPTRLVRIEEEL